MPAASASIVDIDGARAEALAARDWEHAAGRWPSTWPTRAAVADAVAASVQRVRSAQPRGQLCGRCHPRERWSAATARCRSRRISA